MKKSWSRYQIWWNITITITSRYQTYGGGKTLVVTEEKKKKQGGVTGEKKKDENSGH